MTKQLSRPKQLNRKGISTLEQQNINSNYHHAELAKARRTRRYYKILCLPSVLSLFVFSYFHNENKLEGGIWLSYYLLPFASSAPLRDEFFRFGYQLWKLGFICEQVEKR
jgi:hypothetical protein